MKSNKHITILCHPFRDGNLQHIKVTGRLLEYLVIEKKFNPITLKDLPHDHERRLKTNEIDTINHDIKLNRLVPRNKRDCISIVPQNLMTIYRLMKKGHTTW